MINFFNNPRETEEQKHQRTDNARMQMPYNPGQPQMTPRQIVEQTWDRSEAEQTAREKELEPMKNMSTHDAFEFAWNKSAKEQENKVQLINNINSKNNSITFDDDIISKNNSYFTNLSNWIYEKNRIDKMKLSDENKHRYMSCLASKGNSAMRATGIALGIGKELDDYRKKLFNSEVRNSYKGSLGVWMDGSKDLKNNFKGIIHGYDDCNDCQSLLYYKKL